MAMLLPLPRRVGGSEIRSFSAPPSPDRITLIGAEPSLELYQPLLPWQTRLIQLLPGDELDPLQCRLDTVEITAHDGLGIVSEARLQEYEALSCPWDPTEPKTSLICNEISIEVPSILAQALHYLRQELTSRWIWCDALCVNHDDLEEKSAQTHQNFLLFQKAASVVGWLGVPDAEAEIVLEAIDSFSNWGRSASTDFLHAMQTFASRPWFRSIWARQASIATKDLTLQCGHFVISFHQFCRFALKNGFGGVLEVLYNDHIESSKRTLHSYDRTLTDTFFEFLSGGSAFESPDCRDRVYGSVALIDHIWTKAGRKSFLQDYPIDYSMDLDEVFEDTMIFLINQERSLAILNTLGARDLSCRIPSWTCDWQKQGLRLPAHRRDYGGQLPPIFVKDGRLTLIGSFIGTMEEELDWLAEPVFETYGSPRISNKRSSVNLPASLNMKKAKIKDDNVLDLCYSGAYGFHTIKFADGTSSNALGVAAPVEAQKGDEIAIMHGCNAPFVLRWSANGFKVVGACWMWNTFSARTHEDEMHHYFDFDSWSQMLYRSESNESIINQAKIRRTLKTTSWHRRYWLETGQMHGEQDARKNSISAFADHDEWIKHAQAGNAIREYTLC